MSEANSSRTTRPMAMVPLSDLNDLDAVVHALGIEDSDTTPAEAVAELHAEIERLRAIIARYRMMLRSIARGRLDNGRPITGRDAQERAQAILLEQGDDWKRDESVCHV